MTRIQLGTASLPNVFDVTDPAYGALGDGVTDDYDAIQAAMDACDDAGGGEVYIPAGTYLLQRSGRSGLWFPLNSAHTIKVRGAGRSSTILKLTSTTVTAFKHNDPVDGDTIQNVVIEDLTVNANNVTSSGSGVICQFSSSLSNGLNGQDIEIRRCDAINVGNLATGTGRRCISMVNSRSYPAVSLRTWKNILVEDCNLGHTGGGGNTGVHIAVNISGGDRNAVERFSETGMGTANVYYDNITCRRVRWDSGTTTPTSKTSAGIQLVGHGVGGHLLIDDCWLKGSGDTGIEVDSALYLTIRDCYVQDCFNAGYYIANNHGGLVTPEQHYCKITDCVAKCTVALGSWAAFSGAAHEGSEFGHFTLTRCQSVRTNPNFGSGAAIPSHMFYFTGPMRSFTMRDCTHTHLGQVISRTGLSAATSYSLSPNAIRLGIIGSNARVLIDGFEYEVGGSLDQVTGTGLMTYNHDVILIQTCTKAHITIKNVRSFGPGFTLAGAITPTSRVREVGFLNAQANIDDDLTSSLIAGDMYMDAGSAVDDVQTSGILKSLANHATKRRFRWLSTSDTGTTNATSQIMRVQDACLLVTGKAPSTRTGFELGAYLKGSDDGQTRLEGVLVDDGAASSLVIRKVVNGGAPTVLATTALTRITANASYGVRFKQQGNVLTLEQFTTNATQLFATAGAASATYTLLTTDIVAFGEDSAIGWCGFSWVPVDVDAEINRFKIDRMCVISSALIERITPRATTNLFNGFSGFRMQGDTPQTRVKNIKLRHCDFSQRKGHGTVVDLDVITSQKPFVHMQESQWCTNPTMNGTITAPGSGVAYQNTDMYAEDVYIYGGTLTTPFVEVSRDGGTTYAQVAGASTEKMVRLLPGDLLRTTYSVAPTFSKVPVL